MKVLHWGLHLAPWLVFVTARQLASWTVSKKVYMRAACSAKRMETTWDLHWVAQTAARLVEMTG